MSPHVMTRMKELEKMLRHALDLRYQLLRLRTLAFEEDKNVRFVKVTEKSEDGKDILQLAHDCYAMMRDSLLCDEFLDVAREARTKLVELRRKTKDVK